MIGGRNDDAIKIKFASVFHNLLPFNSARSVWKLLAGTFEVRAIHITQRHDLLAAHFLNVVPRSICRADTCDTQLVRASRTDFFKESRCRPK